MRKVVAYQLLSLDGVAEEPFEFIAEFDEVMGENMQRVILDQDAVILGRRTFEEWANFWPTSDIEPFATFINGVQKYVVTSSVPDTTWARTTVISDDHMAQLEALKQGSGGDIGVHGSIALTRSLIEEGFVDELRLVIAPAVQGRGRRLWDGLSSRSLVLVRSVASPSGSLLVDYELVTHSSEGAPI